MKRCRKDKALWELFVFAVCIKRVEGSSAIHPEVGAVRRMLNCSYYKAVRLIEGAKHCPMLFRYYPEANLLIARSFTHGRLQRSEYSCGRKTFIAYHAFCYKYSFDTEDRISHFAISISLRDVLIKQAIKARQLKYGLTTVVPDNKISTRTNRRNALYAVKLGHFSGYHHSTATRHIRKMEKSGEISVFRPDFIKVADFKTGEVLTEDPALLSRVPFLRNSYLVVRDANEYILTDMEKDVFTNIIFNHKGRHRSHLPANLKNETRQARLDRVLGYLWL